MVDMEQMSEDSGRPQQRRSFVVRGAGQGGGIVNGDKPTHKRVFVHQGQGTVPTAGGKLGVLSDGASDKLEPRDQDATGGPSITEGAVGQSPPRKRQFHIPPARSAHDTPAQKRNFAIPSEVSETPTGSGGQQPEGKRHFVIAPAVPANPVPVQKRRFAIPLQVPEIPKPSVGQPAQKLQLPIAPATPVNDAPLQKRRFAVPSEVTKSAMPSLGPLPQERRRFAVPAPTPPSDAPVQRRRFAVPSGVPQVPEVTLGQTPQQQREFATPINPALQKRKFLVHVPSEETHNSDAPAEDNKINRAPAGGIKVNDLPTEGPTPKTRRAFVIPSCEGDGRVPQGLLPSPITRVGTPPTEATPGRKLGDIEGSPDSTLDLPLPVAVEQIINDARPVNPKPFYYSAPPEARRLMVRNISQRHNGPIHPLVGYHSAKSPADIDLDRLDYPAESFRPPLESCFTEQQLENVHWKVKTANFQMSTYQEKLQFVRGSRMTQLEWELNNINTFSDIGKELEELHDMLLPWVR